MSLGGNQFSATYKPIITDIRELQRDHDMNRILMTASRHNLHYKHQIELVIECVNLIMYHANMDWPEMPRLWTDLSSCQCKYILGRYVPTVAETSVKITLEFLNLGLSVIGVIMCPGI